VDELGSLLREAREAKGLTLAEAQQATRINSSFLEALEDGRYDLLPTQVHVRGYLRNYAKYLELDPKPLLDRYELNKDNFRNQKQPVTVEDISGLEPIPPREDQVFFDPVNMDLSGGAKRDSGSALRIIIILALIASLALIANRFIPLITGNGDGSEALSSGIEEAVSNITNETEGQPTITPDPAIIPGAGDPITSTSRNTALQLPTPTATRPSLPATLEQIRMRLEITERTWMRVTIDDEVVFEGLAREGDGPFEWEASERAQLLTGNAIGVFVTINDVELGRLGDRAQIVDETWTTTGNG
jgi:cytoskeleton protein RodZ